MSARLLTMKDLAAYLSVSVPTIRRMADAGKLPKPLRLHDRIVRWDREAVDGYLDKLGGNKKGYVDPDEALAAGEANGKREGRQANAGGRVH